jgi:sialate O-acetylesterase
MQDSLHRAAIRVAALLVLVGMLLATSGPVFAENEKDFSSTTISLGAPFTDRAVLQRGMPVPVWGWAEPGEKITVEFADQKKIAVADDRGKWMLNLAPLKASAEPAVLMVKGGKGQRIAIKDILVGEVWLASGQSNMQWLASKCDVGRILQKGIAERVEAGKEKQPIIREAQVTDVSSALHPIERAGAQWSSDHASMSAIAYAFAYDIYREVGVPIGILNCSFSSTTIEAWTPREGFMAGRDDYTKSVYQKILQTDPSTAEHKQAWDAYYQQIEAAIEDSNRRIAKGEPVQDINIQPPGNLAGNRDASWLFNARLNPMVPYAIRGAIWNQGYANLGGGLNYYHNLHSLIRGWRLKFDRPELPVYFHQFYSHSVDPNNHPSFTSASDMRLGAAMARDIPNAGMASQIDISGSVHYYNKALPGQRLARHALKNQYGKDLVADGPIFKSYTVKGNQLIVEFDYAEGGLVVAETGTNSKATAIPTVMPDGESEVALFYLADENKAWHRAKVKIDGRRVVLTAPGVVSPRGVSYGTGGIGNQPNLYNKALLPMTPFTAYNHKRVTANDWPHHPPKIEGYMPDPSTGGMQYEYRKMPLLSTQFRDNAVLQQGKPLVIWGSSVHDWGYEAKGEAVIKFEFAGIRKTIPVKPGMMEWSVTLPPMKPSAESRTLRVAFEIDGELVHERILENIVIGDVWFVAAPATQVKVRSTKASNSVVRVMQRKAKRDRFLKPSRFSVAVSTTPKNRFACEWKDESGGDLAGLIGHRIAAKTGHPVGIILMQSSAGQDNLNPPLKSWIPFYAMKDVPSLASDYEKVGTRYPGSPSYNANLRRYVKDWKHYWDNYIPAMIKTKSVPDGATWGVMPQMSVPGGDTPATQCYNVMVHSFTPATLKGVIFFTAPTMFSGEKAEHFDEQMSSLANAWKKSFGNDVPLFYTMPTRTSVSELYRPGSIAGKHAGFEVPLDPEEASGPLIIDEAHMKAIDAIIDSADR